MNATMTPKANLPVNTDTAQLQYRFRPYDSQIVPEIAVSQRAVKCLYKENMKTKEKAGENSYIAIPTAHVTEKVVIENVIKLAPYVVQFLQSVEDGIIKTAHKTGSLGFTDSYFSLDKLLEVLDESGQGNRLNAEKIGDWFKAEMRDKLVEAFAAKLGVGDEPTEQELDKLASITTAYQSKFASLASGKTHYRAEECVILQKALEVTGANEGAIGEKFYNRLEKMKEQVSNNALMDLL